MFNKFILQLLALPTPPDNIPEKTYPGAHPYHIPGAEALKFPLHVF
jgi:hypothetical protein